MERRDSLVTIRANATERELLAAIAQRLDRTEAGTFRILLTEKAQELGITPTNEKRLPNEAAGVRT